jgi:hypothetical protein
MPSTREDGAEAVAEPVLSLCEEFNACLGEAGWWGLPFRPSIGAIGRTKTVLMIGDGELPSYASFADYVVRRLANCQAIIADRDLRDPA